MHSALVATLLENSTKALVHLFYLHPRKTLFNYFSAAAAIAFLNLGIAFLVAIKGSFTLIAPLCLFRLLVGIYWACTIVHTMIKMYHLEECSICDKKLDVRNFGSITLFAKALPFVGIFSLGIGFAMVANPTSDIKTFSDVGPYLQSIFLCLPLTVLSGCGYLSRLELEFDIATDSVLQTEKLKGCTKAQLLHIADLADEFSNHANAMTIERLAQGKKLERY